MCLEGVFGRSVMDARSQELLLLIRYHLVKSVNLALSILIPVMACCITILMVYLWDSAAAKPSAIAVVSMCALFRMLRMHINMLPTVFNSLTEARVSVRRIEAYFRRKVSPITPPYAVTNGPAESITLAIEGHTCEVKRGDLVVIRGDPEKVSVLFNSVLARMGTERKIATCTIANPWLQQATIRENILFGSDFEAGRYANVIQACQLEHDFSASLKDHKDVSRNGSNLSGGQRIRICLARLAYSNADIVLIDDIFSALDSKTAHGVSRECISTFLEKRTRFVLDNQHHLQDANLVIDLGCASDGQTGRSIPTHIQASDLEIVNRFGPLNLSDESLLPKPLASFKRDRKEGSPKSAMSRMPIVWIRNSGGLPFVISTILLVILINYTRTTSDKMVALWKGTPSRSDLWLYGLFSVSQGLFPMMLSFIFTYACTRGANKTHQRALEAVLNVPLGYHLVTPPGKIANRFGRDLEIVDIDLTISTRAFLVMLGSFAFTYKAIFEVKAIFALPLLLILFSYLALQAIYRKALCYAKREESRRRGPLLSFVLETMDGLELITGLRQQPNFRKAFAQLLTDHSQIRAFFLVIVGWFELRIHLLGNLGTFAVGCGALLWGVDSAMVAFLINYSNTLSGAAMWAIRQWALTESYMIAYERVFNLTRLPYEAASPGDAHHQLEGLVGDLEVDDVRVSMNDGSFPVLNGITMVVVKGSKVSISGRSGSGKSTLLLALIGLVPLSNGRVFYNGHELTLESAHHIRRQVGYLSQEAVIFGGTLRFNLDPHGMHTDIYLWSIVRLLGIAAHSLDGPLHDCSILVRELVAFGRLLLSEAMVMLLDEPLASMESSRLVALLADPDLSRHFARSTVVVVSHRPEWRGFCQHHYEMSDGLLLGSGNMNA